MNRLQAFNRAKKLLGARVALRYNEAAPDSDEQRARMREAFAIQRNARDRLDRALADRLDALKAGDATYQRLLGERKAAGDALRSLPSGDAYRVTIGTIAGVGGMTALCVEVRANNFAEAIAKLEAKKGTAKATA